MHVTEGKLRPGGVGQRRELAEDAQPRQRGLAWYPAAEGGAARGATPQAPEGKGRGVKVGLPAPCPAPPSKARAGITQPPAGGREEVTWVGGAGGGSAHIPSGLGGNTSCVPAAPVPQLTTPPQVEAANLGIDAPSQPHPVKAAQRGSPGWKKGEAEGKPGVREGFLEEGALQLGF